MNARATVAALAAYTLELREAEVKLNQNESAFDVPPEVKKQLLDAMAEQPWNLYPDFESSRMREALSRTFALEPANILVGNGSNELLAAAIGAFVGPGVPVVFPRPTFTLYEKLIAIAGGLPVPIDFDPDSGELPLAAMLAALEGLRDAVVIFCSPNNPTGGVMPQGGLDRLLATGATVLFDRAYGDFAGDSLPPLDDRLVTFSTFSKAWGLAGLRVGWLASTTSTCRQIRKVKLPYSLNIFSEMVACAALENRVLRERNIARTLTERERVLSRLRELSGVTFFPTAANFVSFRPERRSSRELFDGLLARGILIRDVSSYPRMKNCLRVSIGEREQNDRFLAAMKELL